MACPSVPHFSLIALDMLFRLMLWRWLKKCALVRLNLKCVFGPETYVLTWSHLSNQHAADRMRHACTALSACYQLIPLSLSLIDSLWSWTWKCICPILQNAYFGSKSDHLDFNTWSSTNQSDCMHHIAMACACLHDNSMTSSHLLFVYEVRQVCLRGHYFCQSLAIELDNGHEPACTACIRTIHRSTCCIKLNQHAYAYMLAFTRSVMHAQH